MHKKHLVLFTLALSLLLGACQSSSTLPEAYECPVSNLEWGMSGDEILHELADNTYNRRTQTDSAYVLEVQENLMLLGHPCRVELHIDGVTGLGKITAFLQRDSVTAIAEAYTPKLGKPSFGRGRLDLLAAGMAW